MGFRRAYDVALPKAIASKIIAGPKVWQLGNDLAADGMRSISETFNAELDRPERLQVDEFVERAHVAAARA